MENRIITLKQCVRDNLLMWPDLFKNALDVYEHLFCTNGNGYEWVGGCLVECGQAINQFSVEDAIDNVFESAKDKDILATKANLLIALSDAQTKTNKKSRDENIKDDIVKTMSNIIDKIQYNIELCHRIDERCDDFEVPSESGKYKDRIYNTPKYNWEIYPLCEYSKICCIPDDVREDWLEGCKFMLEFIKTHPQNWPSGFLSNIKEWIPKIEARIAELSNR